MRSHIVVSEIKYPHPLHFKTMMKSAFITNTTFLQWELQPNLNEPIELSYKRKKKSDSIKVNSPMACSVCLWHRSQPIGCSSPCHQCLVREQTFFSLYYQCAPGSVLLRPQRYANSVLLLTSYLKGLKLQEDCVTAFSKWHVCRDIWFNSSDRPEETWSREKQNMKSQ